MGTSYLRQLPLIDEPTRAKCSDPAINSRNTERVALHKRYASKLIINPELDRTMVSFQANKSVPLYRWLKYKEGFSSEMVRYFLESCGIHAKGHPRVLDPFAGAGTTLTTAAVAGWKAVGIELLPVGISAIRARLSAVTVDVRLFHHYLERLAKLPLDASAPDAWKFPHIRITLGAFPDDTERALSDYMTFLHGIQNSDVRFLFWFACLSILEDISYTRKDGQYLRWDHRSGRALSSCFDKGIIHDFRSAIMNKLQLMLEDLRRRPTHVPQRDVKVIEGSCLTELPKLPDNSFEMILTSPPYCNRYDYTRTYALELAFLGYDEEHVKNLRQTLLSATVENKSKRDELHKEYRVRDQEERYIAAMQAFRNQEALHEVLGLLYEARDAGKLNNNNIPSMVENYFFEMNLIIRECARVLTPGGCIIMVNDNVQYNGEEVPVDLILSDFAASAGLAVEHIWVLPKGKGNSSQQMGNHGRNEIRKCVYVWRKPKN